MFKNIFKVLGTIASAIPIVKELWYSVKKDVPRVLCPECIGTGQVTIYRNPDRTPDPRDTIVKCPICNGTGKIRSTEVPKEKP